jgi:hypothetical protein
LAHLLSQGHITPSRNGFVRAVYHAYSSHHHLVLRPDDVWFAILSQLSFFINAHAEELRAFFVEHEGKKKLEVMDVGTIHTADFGKLAIWMTELIAKNVRDPELVDWTMPVFSTTTLQDRVVAAVLLMGALQRYFEFRASLMCGIPSVTLLGTRQDWVSLLAKLDKLSTLGAEPAQFATLLTPVLRRFVRSFDHPDDPEVLDFWARVMHETGGSGPRYLSGWITAFCFWDEGGACLYKCGGEGRGPEPRASLKAFNGRVTGCELDGIFYHRVKTNEIPAGFAGVPVEVNDNGTLYETRMVAGSVGISVSSSGQRLDPGPRQRVGEGQMVDAGPDTLQPVSGWFMYEVESKEDEEAREQEKRKIREAIEKLTQEKGFDRKQYAELLRRQKELMF